VVSLVNELPGESEVVQRLRSDITLAAQTALPVLLLGATGSGKELVARLIHRLSDRRNGPFVVVNLAAMPFSLAAAELVGHAKGAFTGAGLDKPGLLEHAHGGTILLDEIGEASLELQALILSLLETQTVRRLGEGIGRTVDARVVCATNRDLTLLVRGGTFRPDLLNRLSGIVIKLPSLRERRADIPLLAARFLKNVSKGVGRQLTLAPDAIEALENHSFPGNFRELENVLRRAVLTTTGSIIHVDSLHLPKAVPPRRRRPRAMQQLELARREIDVLQAELSSLRARSIVAQPIWQGRGLATAHDYCFVLMPFGDIRDLQLIYRDHVKPVIERSGLRCERADDIYDISGVMQSVWEGINKARIVVADLTERNANVFYELGVAHTLGKPVIMLSQSIDFVPFDLRHLRCITYTYTPRGATELEKALARTIKTVLSTTADLRVAGRASKDA